MLVQPSFNIHDSLPCSAWERGSPQICIPTQSVETRGEDAWLVSLNCTRRLTENSLPYRQLLLRCSNSCIHAVVRCQQIGLKIRFYSLNSSLFASQNRIFILSFLSSSLRALFSVSLLARNDFRANQVRTRNQTAVTQH